MIRRRELVIQSPVAIDLESGFLSSASVDLPRLMASFEFGSRIALIDDGSFPVRGVHSRLPTEREDQSAVVERRPATGT
jgi:hypothetical protein